MNLHCILLVLLFLLISCRKSNYILEDISESKPDELLPIVEDLSKNPFLGFKQLGSEDFGSNILDSTLDEDVKGMVLDSEGNIFVYGNVTGSFNCIQTASNRDGFVMKLDSDRNFLWAKQLCDDELLINDSSATESINDASVDSNGNIYLAGSTRGSFVQTNGNIGNDDMVITKINSNGVIQWVKHFGDTSEDPSAGKELSDYVQSAHGIVSVTTSSDYANGIKVDGSDNIYVTGSSRGNFADITAGGDDGVILKLDSNGNLLLAKQIGNNYLHPDINDKSSNEKLKRFVMDSNSNIYTAFDISSNLGEVNASSDCVVAKFDANADLLWLKQFGAGAFGSNVNDTSGVEVCRNLVIDANNDVYVTGETFSDFNEQNGGSYDIFVAKLLGSNGSFVWARHFGDHSISSNFGANLLDTSRDEKPSTIAIRGDKLYIGGNTRGSLGEVNASVGTNFDLFFISMNIDGSFNWIRHLGAGDYGANLEAPLSSTDNDLLYGIAVTDEGYLFATGKTEGSLGENSSGGYDTFVFKMGINDD